VSIQELELHEVKAQHVNGGQAVEVASQAIRGAAGPGERLDPTDIWYVVDSK
jgi:hypothetical protein